MKAVYYEGHGRFSVGRCHVQQPGRGEVRLEVSYCGVCGTDLHIAQGHMDHRVSPPQVIGHEMSGKIAEVGADVEGFEVGDEVVVRPLDTRGETLADRGYGHIAQKLRFFGIDSPGAFQASWTVPAFTLHKLPAGIDLRLAALVETLAVACHDVRRGDVSSGETVVVIGGGPIGMLVGLVAQARGADVLLSEINPHRRRLTEELGLEAVHLSREDIVAEVMRRTEGAGADVVFEVSGSDTGADLMTALPGLRGRIVVVAIFSEPTKVRLFDLFWKELQVLGARVYEPEDYEQAITFVASGLLPLEKLVTSVEPLEQLPAVFEDLAGNSRSMKILVDCQS